MADRVYAQGDGVEIARLVRSAFDSNPPTPPAAPLLEEVVGPSASAFELTPEILRESGAAAPGREWGLSRASDPQSLYKIHFRRIGAMMPPWAMPSSS